MTDVPSAMPAPSAVAAPKSNGFAVAALVLGIAGFVITPIPLFVGFFIGGPLNILAIIFGICGIVRANRTGSRLAMSIVGLVLGGLAFISIFFGAGIVW